MDNNLNNEMLNMENIEEKDVLREEDAREEYVGDEVVRMEDDFEDDEIEEEGETSPRARRLQKMLLVAAIVCCLTILAGGTLAYFTAEETAKNVITTGVLDMELVELGPDGKEWPEGGVSGVMPGMEIEKKPFVKNIGGVDFWTRMRADVKVEKDGKELSNKYVSFTVDGADWIDGGDGWFYCKEKIAPLGESPMLFEEVEIDKDMGNAYMDATIYVDVVAQAVQWKNNGETVMDAKGWGE